MATLQNPKTAYSLCADKYLQQVADAVQGSGHDAAFGAVHLHIYVPPPAQPRQLNVLLVLLGCRYFSRSLELAYEPRQPLCIMGAVRALLARFENVGSALRVSVICSGSGLCNAGVMSCSCCLAAATLTAAFCLPMRCASPSCSTC